MNTDTPKATPIDVVWADKPEPSKARLVVHPDSFTGKSSAAKRQEMGDFVVDLGRAEAVLPHLGRDLRERLAEVRTLGYLFYVGDRANQAVLPLRGCSIRDGPTQSARFTRPGRSIRSGIIRPAPGRRTTASVSTI